MNTILILVAVTLVLYLGLRVHRRRVLDRRMHSDLNKRFPRRPLTLLVMAILCWGCTGKGNVSSAINTPSSPSDPGSPSGGGPSGGGPGGGGTPTGGDPQIIEAEGCQNNQPAPAQYQPFSCQLKLPVQVGDAVDAIYWTNSSVTLSTTTVKVTDTDSTSYLPVVSVPRTGSVNDTVWIASGVISISASSLNVTVDPGSGSNTTIRDLVLVHTRGGAGTFKTVTSNGCTAPATSTPGPCLPITGPSLTPALNDLVFVVALSDEHIFNAQTFTSPFSFLWVSADGGNASGTAVDGYFVVGAYNATSTTAVQPTLAVDQTSMNTNFGWTYSVLEASFD